MIWAFFVAIQSLQQRKGCKNSDELVNAVMDNFTELNVVTLNKVFLSLQFVLREIIVVKEDNTYKVPPMKKNTLLNQNALPHDLEVPEEIVRNNIEYLNEEGQVEGISKLIANLDM